jgi:hypothetical protein
MEIHLGSEIVALRRDVSSLRTIGDGGALVRRVAKCEQDIAELKNASREVITRGGESRTSSCRRRSSP